MDHDRSCPEDIDDHDRLDQKEDEDSVERAQIEYRFPWRKIIIQATLLQVIDNREDKRAILKYLLFTIEDVN